MTRVSGNETRKQSLETSNTPVPSLPYHLRLRPCLLEQSGMLDGTPGLPLGLKQLLQLLGEQLPSHALRAAHTSGQNPYVNDARLGVSGGLLEGFPVQPGGKRGGQGREYNSVQGTMCNVQ